MILTPSPNHDARPEDTVIDMLVLHYTGMESAGDALARLCDPAAKVSAHYMITENGKVMRLVSEGRRAWHAGVASWRGNTDINARSIGIELVNPGHEFGYTAFTEPQMAALIALCKDILSRHAIPAHNIVGHSDVAPTRKQDPGERFDWARLASEGIGLYPFEDGGSDDAPMSDATPETLITLLERIGYGADIDTLKDDLTAFQRHWRPALVNGEPDEETVERLTVLSEMI